MKINYSFNKLCILQNCFKFNFENQRQLSLVHCILGKKHIYDMQIRKLIVQRPVLKQGVRTGLNYLQLHRLRLHRHSISRMHSHVTANLHRAGCEARYATCRSLCYYTLNFKDNVLLCQKRDSCFFQVLPTDISGI